MDLVNIITYFWGLKYKSGNMSSKMAAKKQKLAYLSELLVDFNDISIKLYFVMGTESKSEVHDLF